MVSHLRAGERETTPPAELSPDDARSAVKLGVMRYVLAISLAGAVVGMVIAWLYFGW
jgi:type VI protein secretion system component VasF